MGSDYIKRLIAISTYDPIRKGAGHFASTVSSLINFEIVSK